MNDKISEKDKKDWNNFISNKEKLKNKDVDINKTLIQKIRSIDLHGLTLDQANKKISNFIKECYLENVNKIIVITGKGLHSQNEKNPYISKKLSILKYSVPEFIKNNGELLSLIYEFGTAKIEDGGSGAFYIYLKKKK